jgi:hypothetical protein
MENDENFVYPTVKEYKQLVLGIIKSAILGIPYLDVNGKEKLISENEKEKIIENVLEAINFVSEGEYQEWRVAQIDECLGLPVFEDE